MQFLLDSTLEWCIISACFPCSSCWIPHWSDVEYLRVSHTVRAGFHTAGVVYNTRVFPVQFLLGWTLEWCIIPACFTCSFCWIQHWSGVNNTCVFPMQFLLDSTLLEWCIISACFPYPRVSRTVHAGFHTGVVYNIRVFPIQFPAGFHTGGVEYPCVSHAVPAGFHTGGV